MTEEVRDTRRGAGRVSAGNFFRGGWGLIFVFGGRNSQQALFGSEIRSTSGQKRVQNRSRGRGVVGVRMGPAGIQARKGTQTQTFWSG